MVLLILGLVLFLATHLYRVVLPAHRRQMIAALGEKRYQGLYSLASIATFVLLIYGFGQARQETDILYTPPFWISHLTALLMLFAMISISAFLLPAGHIATRLKHPMLVAVKIWALAHLLANGETSSVLLFGAFLAWAVVVRISAKRREQAGETVPRAFAGVQYDVFAVLLGIALTIAFIGGLHYWLIGVQPLAMS